MATVLAAYPQARGISTTRFRATARAPAARQAAGRPSETIYHFDKADVVLSLDADFLACGPGSVRYARDFADRRRVSDEQKTMNRLYAVESTPSLTGAKADHRLPMRASDVEGFARQIAAGIGAGVGRREQRRTTRRGSRRSPRICRRIADARSSSPASTSRPRCTRSRTR